MSKQIKISDECYKKLNNAKHGTFSETITSLLNNLSYERDVQAKLDLNYEEIANEVAKRLTRDFDRVQNSIDVVKDHVLS